MLIDFSPRQSGKTTRLIKWLAEDLEQRLLVTFDRQEASRLRYEHPKYAERIVSWQEFILDRRGLTEMPGTMISVDNADLILESYLGRQIFLGTFSTPEPHAGGGFIY